jgi:predicted PurR-regulated permease PerM
MVTNVPGYIENLTEWEKNFLKDHENLRPVFDKALNFIVEWTNTSLLPQLQSLAGTVMPMIFGFVTALIDIAIGLVISVFILAGRKTLAKKSKIFLHCLFKEKNVDLIVDEAKYADRMFSGFLEGKVIDSAIIGILYYIFLELMNVPYPALVAVICGVTNIIPIFGPFIGSVPSGLIILSADPIKVIPFIIFVCVIQFFDGYIIDPHIVGGNIQLSSFCVVFAVLVFGGLWGFVGLLVGVPTFAVIYDIVKKIVYSILKKKGKYDIIAKYKLTYSDDGPSKNKLVFLKKNKSNKEVKTSEVASEK